MQNENQNLWFPIVMFEEKQIIYNNDWYITVIQT